MSFPEPLGKRELDVKISELLVATADGHDPALDRAIAEVLRTLRQHLRMDVVFVSEFVDGERVFRFVDGGESTGIEVGDAAPLEESYCQRVVEGRMPELVVDAAVLVARGELPRTDIPVGGHLSTPVILPDGRVFGTVCCFSKAPSPGLRDGDLATLRQCARLVARKVDLAPPVTFAATQPMPIDWPTLDKA